MRKLALMILSLLMLTLSLFGGSAQASDGSLNRFHRLSAGFLLQFTSYVDWPPKDGQGINLCIIAEEPFAEFVDQLIKNRPTNRKGEQVLVHRVLPGNSIEHCQLIYLNKTSATPAFWQSIPKKHSILLISEYKEFTENGGLISIYLEDNQIQLGINLDMVKKAKLIISSQLLKLANIGVYTKDLSQ